MATIATHSSIFDAPSYVQTMFDWDAPTVESSPTVGRVGTDVKIAATDNKRSGHKKSGHKKSGSMQSAIESSVSQVSARRQPRRGHCQHVGGVMGAVLGQYGIGIDELISEIERLKRGEA